MNEKIEKLETNFFMLSKNNLMQIHTDENYSFDSMNTFEFMMSVLPLKNEENLTTFEKNLLDINLKKKVVSYKAIKYTYDHHFLLKCIIFRCLSYRV